MKFNPINSIKTLYYRQFNRIDPRPGKMLLHRAFTLKRGNMTISNKTIEKLKEIYKNSLFETSKCRASIESISNIRRELRLVDDMLADMKKGYGKAALAALAEGMRKSFDATCAQVGQSLPGQGSDTPGKALTASSRIAMPTEAAPNAPAYSAHTVYEDPTRVTFTLTHALDVFENAYGGAGGNTNWLTNFIMLRYGLGCGSALPEDPAEALEWHRARGHYSLKMAEQELEEFQHGNRSGQTIPVSAKTNAWVKAFERLVRYETNHWMTERATALRTHNRDLAELAVWRLGFHSDAMASETLGAASGRVHEGYGSDSDWTFRNDDWESWSDSSSFTAAPVVSPYVPGGSGPIYANIPASKVRSMATTFDTQGFTAPQPICR